MHYFAVVLLVSLVCVFLKNFVAEFGKELAKEIFKKDKHK